MDDSKELKTGMTTSYDIGGKKVTLKPLTLGKMKKATAAFSKKSDTFEMLEDHLFEVLTNGDNPFVTREWIRENITLPLASQMVADIRRINGLEDFLKGPASNGSAKVERDLQETAPTPSV